MAATIEYTENITLKRVVDEPRILLNLIDRGFDTEPRLAAKILESPWSDLDEYCLIIRRLLKTALDNKLLTSVIPPQYSETQYKLRKFKLTRKGSYHKDESNKSQVQAL